MTATLTTARGATVATRPAASGRGAADRGTRPRLLLPPVAEPSHAALPGALAALATVRSVLSPLTTAEWPVPGRADPPAEPDLEDPTRLCGAVVVAAIEALRCTRPLAQLARWVSPEVYEALAAATSPAPAGPRGRAVVRSVRLSRVSPTVAEGTVVVHDGTRVRAAAARFEVHRGGWRATVLQIG